VALRIDACCPVSATERCAQITPHTIAAMKSIAAADAIRRSIFTATRPNLKQESLIGNAPGANGTQEQVTISPPDRLDRRIPQKLTTSVSVAQAGRGSGLYGLS
jgi:hypothetical protein